MVFESEKREDTYEFGIELAKNAIPGGVYALYGDLGTGKTVFAQGFAEGLGVREIVNSPTFTILQVYEDGRLPFYHFDVYRLGDPSEAEEIGFEEYVSGDGVSLIEWADIIEELLPPETVRITIKKEPDKGEDYRRIEVIP